MGYSCTNPTHECTAVTKEITIKGSKSTTNKSKLRATVVREQRIGVLKESDENKPVVHPECVDP